MIAYQSSKRGGHHRRRRRSAARASHEFGIMTRRYQPYRITKFSEKPQNPERSRDGRTWRSAPWAFMSSERACSIDCSKNTRNVRTRRHDFGRNIIPAAIEYHEGVSPIRSRTIDTRAQNYWRDVGTVDAFYEANMELVHVNPELNIYDEQWPIWTYQRQYPPAKFVLDEDGRRGMAVNSMVSGGCIISGAYVNQSLLFSNVRADERSYIERSVVFPDVRVGPGSTIKRAIIDTGGVVPPGTQIGVNPEEDARRFYMSENGVALVTRDMLAKLKK